MAFLYSTRSYQGGPCVEVFSSQGRDPFCDCKITNKRGLRKIYDKGVRGYVIYSSVSASARLQMPKSDRKSLKLLQPFFVVQVCVPAGQAFSIALSITDKSHTRRRLHFSSSFSDIKATPLHCQIPLISLVRGKWLNLALNVADFFSANFPGQAFHSIDVVEIGGISKIRKIFTLRDQPYDTVLQSDVGGAQVPRHLDYPPGVDSATQLLDTETISGSEGMRKLREATNQIRPLTEPLVKDIDQSNLAAAKGAGCVGPVHLAFGTRFPAPQSPGHLRKKFSEGLEISLPEDNKFLGGGPLSPGVKLPNVSPRSKTAGLGAFEKRSISFEKRSKSSHSLSRKFDRPLPLQLPKESAATKGAQQRDDARAPSSLRARGGRRGSREEAAAVPRGADADGGGADDVSVSLSTAHMQCSSPRYTRSYSKFRYSDFQTSPRGGVGVGAQACPPVEDIPLSRQNTMNAELRKEPFELETSKSNWESLYTDQSILTPGRNPKSRLSLLPLSSQHDLFGDLDKGDHERVRRSMQSHSKSNSMSSDGSERGDAFPLSPKPEPFAAAGGPAAAGFDPLVGAPSPKAQGLDAKSSSTLVPGLDPLVADLGLGSFAGPRPTTSGLFEVTSGFQFGGVGAIGGAMGAHDDGGNVQACASDLLDEAVCVVQQDDELALEEMADAALGVRRKGPLEDVAMDSDSERGSKGGLSAQDSAENHEMNAEVLHIAAPLAAEERVPSLSLKVSNGAGSASDTQMSSAQSSDKEESDGKERERDVDEETKHYAEMINKHRIFTPPVIPASKVYGSPRFALQHTMRKEGASGPGAGGHASSDEGGEANGDGGALVDVIYDPLLGCYYDAKANRYYELI